MNDILMDSLSSIAPPGLQPAVLPTQVEAKEDPVSELNLMFQKKQLQSSPSYQFEKNGPDNNPTFTFTCTVLLNPMWVGGAEGGQLQQQQGGPAIKRTGNGTAKKKQDAKSAAAKSALAATMAVHSQAADSGSGSALPATSGLTSSSGPSSPAAEPDRSTGSSGSAVAPIDPGAVIGDLQPSPSLLAAVAAAAAAVTTATATACAAAAAEEVGPPRHQPPLPPLPHGLLNAFARSTGSTGCAVSGSAPFPSAAGTPLPSTPSNSDGRSLDPAGSALDLPHAGAPVFWLYICP